MGQDPFQGPTLSILPKRAPFPNHKLPSIPSVGLLVANLEQVVDAVEPNSGDDPVRLRQRQLHYPVVYHHLLPHNNTIKSIKTKTLEPQMFVEMHKRNAGV